MYYIIRTSDDAPMDQESILENIRDCIGVVDVQPLSCNVKNDNPMIGLRHQMLVNDLLIKQLTAEQNQIHEQYNKFMMRRN